MAEYQFDAQGGMYRITPQGEKVYALDFVDQHTAVIDITLLLRRRAIRNFIAAHVNDPTNNDPMILSDHASRNRGNTNVPSNAPSITGQRTVFNAMRNQ